MKAIIGVLAFLNLLAVPAFALEPVPGSITYGPGPTSRLSKAPVGSPVFNHLMYGGQEYNETYLVQPGGSLKLVNRTRLNDN
ncbi:hypothetical protein C0075_02665 [Rhizobium sp. KAs_5_22]|uniref:hypothetical protein n=1 Tax=Ciceribacter selenitireducens TaxID=448181 RepID=UPI00048B3CDB|nr:hypothetical protein [Ciceribacter selenitireducens]PPJ49011.1 hypothetical protein C0075_02665 [Rhizobium sp. KAs_5_22]